MHPNKKNIKNGDKAEKRMQICGVFCRGILYFFLPYYFFYFNVEKKQIPLCRQRGWDIINLLSAIIEPMVYFSWGDIF